MCHRPHLKSPRMIFSYCRPIFGTVVIALTCRNNLFVADVASFQHRVVTLIPPPPRLAALTPAPSPCRFVIRDHHAASASPSIPVACRCFQRWRTLPQRHRRISTPVNDDMMTSGAPMSLHLHSSSSNRKIASGLNASASTSEHLLGRSPPLTHRLLPIASASTSAQCIRSWPHAHRIRLCPMPPLIVSDPIAHRLCTANLLHQSTITVHRRLTAAP